MLNWNSFNDKKSTDYQQLRFPTQCPHEIYYGITPLGERCLLFYLKANNNKALFDNSLENINLTLLSLAKKECLVLNLLNENFKDIFDDLINSFFNHIQTVISEDDAVIEFIICYNKWIEFFKTSPIGLPEKDIKSIIGELLMFDYILKNAENSINDIITSWKGPYGKAHDFELDDIHVEVKSIENTKSYVDISSEYQLDYLSTQQLFLAVYFLKSTNLEGVTISSLIKNIIDFLRSHPRTIIEKFWAVLRKSGLNVMGLTEYDNYKYTVVGSSFYKVSSLDFPKITRSVLDESITDVRYKLSLINLESFKTNKIF